MDDSEKIKALSDFIYEMKMEMHSRYNNTEDDSEEQVLAVGMIRACDEVIHEMNKLWPEFYRSY